MGGRRASGSAGSSPTASRQFLNVTIFSRLKGREGAGCCGFAPAIASVLSQIVDTLIFITIAFYGVFPIAELLLGQMLAKVVLSIVLVPPLIMFAGWHRSPARSRLTSRLRLKIRPAAA
jgi:uncharacterized integral membrane protein (TIGR00697 family)